MVKKNTKKQRRNNKKTTRGGTSPISKLKTITEKLRDNKIKTNSKIDSMRILQEKRKINFEKLKKKINTIDKLQKIESNDVDLLKKELSMCKNELDLCKADLEQSKKPSRLLSDDYIAIEPFIQPHYDLGRATEEEPQYDLGTARQESQTYYDLGKATEEEQPHYDLGTATEEEPEYDLGREDDLALDTKQKRTFTSLIKDALDSNNIKNKDDLDKFCEGVGRKRLYNEVKEKCLKYFPTEKCNHKHFIYWIRSIYQNILPGYKRYKPKKK